LTNPGQASSSVPPSGLASTAPQIFTIEKEGAQVGELARQVQQDPFSEVLPAL
jgi:hypothetical protein